MPRDHHSLLTPCYCLFLITHYLYTKIDMHASAGSFTILFHINQHCYISCKFENEIEQIDWGCNFQHNKPILFYKLKNWYIKNSRTKTSWGSVRPSSATAVLSWSRILICWDVRMVRVEPYRLCYRWVYLSWLLFVAF